MGKRVSWTKSCGKEFLEWSETRARSLQMVNLPTGQIRKCAQEAMGEANVDTSRGRDGGTKKDGWESGRGNSTETPIQSAGVCVCTNLRSLLMRITRLQSWLREGFLRSPVACSSSVGSGEWRRPLRLGCFAPCYPHFTSSIRLPFSRRTTIPSGLARHPSGEKRAS